MRTSLNEIKLIDDHLFNLAAPEERLVFDALLILDPGLAKRVMWQHKTHEIVQQYSRNKLKAEIETFHRKLFSEPQHQSFRQRVLALFSKK